MLFCHSNESETAGPSNKNTFVKRARQPSFSIVYDTNENESAFPWFFQMDVPGSSSDSEVHSVQVATSLKFNFFCKSQQICPWHQKKNVLFVPKFRAVAKIGFSLEDYCGYFTELLLCRVKRLK